MTMTLTLQGFLLGYRSGFPVMSRFALLVSSKTLPVPTKERSCPNQGRRRRGYPPRLKSMISQRFPRETPSHNVPIAAKRLAKRRPVYGFEIYSHLVLWSLLADFLNLLTCRLNSV